MPKPTKLAPFALFVLFTAIVLFRHLYTTNDNDTYMISNVVNGIYGPDNWCLFVNPLLSYGISTFGKLFPMTDLFVVFRMGMCILGFAWMAFCFHRLFSNPRTEITADICLIIIEAYLNISHSNFTVIAGWLACIGFISFLWFMEGRLGKSSLIVGSLMITAGACIRVQGVFLVFPFFGLGTFVIIFHTLFDNRQNRHFKIINTIRALLGAAIPALIIGSLGLFNAHYTATPERQNAIRYSIARAQMTDYDKRYDADADKLIPAGISRNDFQAIKWWILCDTELVNSNYLEILSPARQSVNCKRTRTVFSGFA